MSLDNFEPVHISASDGIHIGSTIDNKRECTITIDAGDWRDDDATTVVNKYAAAEIVNALIKRFDLKQEYT